MINQIRQEQSAMEAAIPQWEWEPEYDDTKAKLAKEKLKIMFGGDGDV